MINKICPACLSKNTLYKKDYMPIIYYYDRKTKGRKTKILVCKNCNYARKINKKSFDKKYSKEFIKFRNKVTKEMIRDIMKSYVSDYSDDGYLEIERLLFLGSNYFNDILTNKRKIKTSDATLIAIIYNFPFIINCTANDFDVNKSIEYMKEFISNQEKVMEENAKMRVNELLGNKEEIVYLK